MWGAGGRDLPLSYRHFTSMVEDFRAHPLPSLGEGWGYSLPRVPLASEESKEVLHAAYLRDEQGVLRKLSLLESDSVQLIVYFPLERVMIRDILKLLRNDREAQITFTSIISATRFQILQWWQAVGFKHIIGSPTLTCSCSSHMSSPTVL